jgi:DNA-binding response OmpR family regulator
MTPAETILKLRQQLRDARDRIAELEHQAGITLFQPPEEHSVHLTPQQGQLLGLLLTRGVMKIVTRDMIYVYLYGALPACDQPQPNTIDVMICKIRKVLKPFNVRIDTDYNNGWYLTKESAEHITQATTHLRIENRRGRRPVHQKVA